MFDFLLKLIPGVFFISKKNIFDLSITYNSEMVERCSESSIVIKCDDFLKDNKLIKKKLNTINDNTLKQSRFNKIKISKDICIKSYDFFCKYAENIEIHDEIYFHDKTMNAIFILKKQSQNNEKKKIRLCVDMVALNL